MGYSRQIFEDMPITYDITKDGFYIRGEEKTLQHVVGACQERGFSMEETAHLLKLPIETVEKYWKKG